MGAGVPYRGVPATKGAHADGGQKTNKEIHIGLLEAPLSVADTNIALCHRHGKASSTIYGIRFHPPKTS